MSIDTAVSSAFYRALLDLKSAADLPGALGQLLRLLIEVTDARVGYLELWNEDGDRGFVRMAGDRSAAHIQERISRGLISRALVEDRTIVTASALIDQRFHDFESVRRSEISSVLTKRICDDNVCGVVYLEGRRQGDFGKVDVENVERFVRELALESNRLVRRTRGTLREQTRDFQLHVVQQVLERHDWNTTTAARELGVARETLYRVRRRQ